MRHVVERALLLLVTGLCVGSAAVAAQSDRRIVGTVVDALTGDPIPYAVVSVRGATRSTVVDQRGRFVLDVPPGTVQLQARVIGYRPATVSIPGREDREDVRIQLERIPVALADIMVTADWVNPAHRIIRGAIARKNELMGRFRDYQYEAYTKLRIDDAAKHRDSADAVILITETHTRAYWEQPDRYQETILGRRQSSNVAAENNLVSVGEIVNFNKDRIDLEKYSVASPTADDALDHYDYFILDTLEVDGRSVFRLAIEPRSQVRPLFAGMIDIADSTFDVLAIDVRANEAIRYDFLKNIRYQQRMEEVRPTYFMPAEIIFSGDISLGIPLPGLPKEMTFSHVATLRDFAFDTGDAPETLGEYLVVVDEGADDVDSTAWESLRPSEILDVEVAAYARIDSLEKRPPSAGDLIGVGVFGVFFLTSQADFFHFNRAEGAYLGVGTTLRDVSPDWIIRLKSGRAFGLDEWQHRYGFNYRASSSRRWWVGLTYRDEVRARPSFVSGGRNSTQLALLGKIDPLDYYQETGWSASTSMKVTNFTTLALGVSDVRQSTVPTVSDFSVFDRDRPLRINPPIHDGRLRALTGSFTYDSRPRLKRKGRDFVFDFVVQTQVTAGWEYTSPSFLDSDFDYLRLFLTMHRVQRTLNLGLTTIDAVAATSFGQLPPQRFFTVDFGNGLVYQPAGFNTMARTNFSGDRAFMMALNHDFDQQLFRRSRLPLIRAIPFTVSVHGGVFWTELANHTPRPGDTPVNSAPDGYVELGFGLGNLTPMLSPFNFATWFTWQLSDYNTSRFKLRIGIPTPN